MLNKTLTVTFTEVQVSALCQLVATASDAGVSDAIVELLPAERREEYRLAIVGAGLAIGNAILVQHRELVADEELRLSIGGLNACHQQQVAEQKEAE